MCTKRTHTAIKTREYVTLWLFCNLLEPLAPPPSHRSHFFRLPRRGVVVFKSCIYAEIIHCRAKRSKNSCIFKAASIECKYSFDFKANFNNFPSALTFNYSLNYLNICPQSVSLSLPLFGLVFTREDTFSQNHQNWTLLLQAPNSTDWSYSRVSLAEAAPSLWLSVVHKVQAESKLNLQHQENYSSSVSVHKYFMCT